MKIHSNLFEISNQGLKFENLIKSLSHLKIYFKKRPMECLCSSLVHNKGEHTHIAPPRGVHIWKKAGGIIISIGFSYFKLMNIQEIGVLGIGKKENLKIVYLRIELIE